MKELPPFLDFLVNEHNYAVTAAVSSLGYELFFINLSALKLRLSNQTPIIQVKKSDIEGITPYQLLQSLQDVIREQRWENRTLIILFDGSSEPILKYTRGPLYSNIVVIGNEEQEKSDNQDAHQVT